MTADRRVGDQVVLACLNDGVALVLAPTATVVWDLLHDWQDRPTLQRLVTERFPTVDLSDSVAAIDEILLQLEEAGLLEQRP